MKKTFYASGKKQVHILDLDRWIKIDKPVRLMRDIPEKAVCPTCGGRTLKTGNILSALRLTRICGDISVDQRWKSNIIRPLCGPGSPKFDHEYMLLLAWLAKEGYNPNKTFCAETKGRKDEK